MKRVILATLLAAPLAVFAATGDFKGKCSMTASKTAKKTELLAMAKVKEAEAKKIALGTAGEGATIVKGGIETEDGCLVYSYHVKAAGHKDQTEVFVDAGDGKIIKSEHESATRAALEKPVDKTKEIAGKTKEATTGKPSTNQAMTK
jgi:hypothetical protein